MTEPQPQKKGTGKGTVAALSVLTVLFAFSTICIYITLQNQVTNLQNQINSLKTAQLSKINEKWSDNHPWFSSPYITLSGTVFNSGTNTASNVVLTIKIYNSANTLLKSEELSIGTIYGKYYSNYETTISYTGDADYVITTLTYT